MTASAAPPENTSEVQSRGKSRLGRLILFGILPIAIGVTIGATDISWFLSLSIPVLGYCQSRLRRFVCACACRRPPFRA